MRQIKFRAWDGYKMYSPAIVDGKDWHLLEDREIKGYPLMQYTGLKDKQGNEIWEGDILEFVGDTCDILSCGPYAYQNYKKGEILVVRKLLSGFTLTHPNLLQWDAPNLVGNVDNYTFWNAQGSLKVIGNIHENPELLPHPVTPDQWTKEYQGRTGDDLPEGTDTVLPTQPGNG